jgi:anaerobic selenocysteine-containing dehydrogenase
MGLASRLNLTTFTNLAGGMTTDDWIKSLYAKSNVPLTYDQFKAAGYYEFPMLTLADQSPVVSNKPFRDDPVKSPMATPSGKIEIYSQYIANFYGVTKNTQDGSVAPWAPPVPQYVEPMEWKNSALAAKYPLYMMTPHGKFAEHSQYHNMSWQRDEDQMYINGYQAMRISTLDAQQRGIKYGDIIRVFNDRGQILCAAKVTERVQPGVVWVFEGGHYKALQPGTVGSLDLGGLGNVLLPTVQCDPLVAGIQASCLVQVEKWGGS